MRRVVLVVVHRHPRHGLSVKTSRRDKLKGIRRFIVYAADLETYPGACFKQIACGDKGNIEFIDLTGNQGLRFCVGMDGLPGFGP